MTVGQYTTLMSFDYGQRRIGIAVGQSITCSASPLTTLESINQKPDWVAIEKIIKEWRPDALIVGMPLNMDGSEHDLSKAARRFGNQLNGRFNLPVHWVDERLTSIEASHRINEQDQRKKKRQDKKTIDTVAAQLILESWFTQCHNTPTSN